MGFLYDFIVNENNIRSNNYDNARLNKLRFVTDENNNYYLENKNKYPMLKLTTMSDLYKVQQRDPYAYFTNLSVIKDAKFTKRYYVCKKEGDWLSNKIYRLTVYSSNLLDIHIMLEKNIQSYIAKNVLFGKGKVIYNNSFCYIILQNNNLNIVSDMVLEIRPDTCFRLNNLRANSIRISNLDISKVRSLVGFFAKSAYLTSIILENFDTSNVKNFSCMFYRCNLLKQLNVKEINTIKGKNFVKMFSECGLENLDLRHFDMSKAEDISEMFLLSGDLKVLDIVSWNLPENCKKINVFLGTFFDNKTHIKEDLIN